MSRLYSPKEYGQLGLILSTAGVLQILGTLRLDLAIKRDDKFERAVSTFSSSLLLVSLLCLLTLIIVYITNLLYSDFLAKNFGPFYYLLPFLTFLLGLWQLTSAVFTREGLFGSKGITEISQSVSSVVLNITSGLLGLGNLVLGSTVSRFLAIAYAYQKIPFRKCIFEKLVNLSIPKIRKTLSKNSDLIRYSIPSSLLYKVNSNLPIFYLATYLDSYLLGFFVFTNRVMLAPINLFGSSLGDIFQNRIRTKIDNKPLLLRTLLKVWGFGFIFIIPISILVLVYGPFIFGIVFGDKWINSGYIASALALSQIFKFTSSITNGTFTMLKLEKVGFVCTLIEFPSKVLIFIFFSNANDIMNVFWAIACYDSLQIIIVNIFLYTHILRRKF